MKRNRLFISIPIIAFIITFSITILFVSAFYSDFKPIINKNEKLIYDKVQENEFFKYKILSTDNEVYISIFKVLKPNFNRTVIVPNEINKIKVKEFMSDNNLFDKVIIDNNKIIISTQKPVSNFGDNKYYKFKEFIGTNNKYYNNTLLPNIIYELNYNDLSYGYDYCFNSSIDYIPSNPHRKGYSFTGWYADATCTELFDFASFSFEENDAIYNPTLLYAGWEAVNHE